MIIQINNYTFKTQYIMKKHTFIFFAAAVVSLAIAACCKEEPVGPASGGPDTIPTTDTIPVVDTIPMDTVTTVPWYASLVGTRWYCHDDFVMTQVGFHHVSDNYWDFVDDSTILTTVYTIELNGIPMSDTAISSVQYVYNPDELKCTLLYISGDTEDYYLDTIQKTLTCDLPPICTPSQRTYHLIEE